MSRVSDPKNYNKVRVHHADNGAGLPLCNQPMTKSDVLVAKAIMADCPLCVAKAGLTPVVLVVDRPKRDTKPLPIGDDPDALLTAIRQVAGQILKVPEMGDSLAHDLAKAFGKLDTQASQQNLPKAWRK